MFNGINISGLSIRIGLPASFAGAAIGIRIALFQVQGWTMPTPIAMALILILLAMIAVALLLIGYELVKEALRIMEVRATSAAWVSAEAPGLLDYEADGLRASKRFMNEITKLGRDTANLGRELNSHTERIQAVANKPPHRKQKRANQSARSIVRSATFIEKRADLLEALVKDILRNYEGMIANTKLETDYDKGEAMAFMATLEQTRGVSEDTVLSISGYRDSVRRVETQNLSRTVRLSSKRLADGIDNVVKILRRFTMNLKKLHDSLEARVNQTSLSTHEAGARRPRPAS